MKKQVLILLILFACSLIMAGPGMEARAEEGDREPLASGPCGKNVSYTFDEQSGTVTITGTGPMYDYDYPTELMDYWECGKASPFALRTQIRHIVIGDGVTYIGKCAFIYTPNLQNITIGNSVTRIGKNILDACRRSSNEAGYTERAWMFRKSLDKVYIPASVTSIDPLSFDTSGVKRFVVAAKNPKYSSARGVIFNKTKTKIIAYPGDGSSNYKMPATVRTIGANAFANSRLKSITFSKNLKTIEKRAFKHTCFRTIRLPDSLTSMSYGVFELCPYLKSINTGNGIKKLNFVYQEGTTSLKLTIGKNVKKIESLPVHTRISVHKDNKYFSAKKNILYNKKGTVLVSYPRLAGTKRKNVTIGKNVRTIRNDAFFQSFNIKYLTIPSTVTKIQGGVVGALDQCDCRMIIFKGKKSLWNKRVKSGAYPKTCDYVIKFTDGYQIPTPLNPYGSFLDGYKTHTGELYLNFNHRYSVTGYELSACQNKTFARKETLTRKVTQTTYSGVMLKEAISWKQAYFRARAYKTVKGKTYYSAWTKPVLIRRK